jgi:hypothetical protein
LRRKLAGHGVDIGHDELLTWLADLAARGLVFTENDQWVAVATRSYGSYYYRRGPGFVVVRDVRAAGDEQRLLIDQGSAEFLEMAEAAHADELSPAARRALPDAVDAGLAVVDDDLTMVLLPYRMRQWPVAYTTG